MNKPKRIRRTKAQMLAARGEVPETIETKFEEPTPQEPTKFASEQEFSQFEADLHNKTVELMKSEEAKPYFFEAPQSIINKISPSGLSKGGYINYKGFCVCLEGTKDDVIEKMSKIPQ